MYGDSVSLFCISLQKESGEGLIMDEIEKSYRDFDCERIECLDCPCYMYCTMDSCINDIDNALNENDWMEELMQSKRD